MVVFTVVLLLVVAEVLIVVDVLEEVIVEVVELPPGLITVSIGLLNLNLMVHDRTHNSQPTVNDPCNLMSLLDAPTYTVNAPLGTTHFPWDTSQ